LLYKDALQRKRRSGVVSQSLLAWRGNSTWQGVYGLADNSYSVRLSAREQVSQLPDHCAAEAGSEMRLFCPSCLTTVLQRPGQTCGSFACWLPSESGLSSPELRTRRCVSQDSEEAGRPNPDYATVRGKSCWSGWVRRPKRRGLDWPSRSDD
jgi:hypothetical protein